MGFDSLMAVAMRFIFLGNDERFLSEKLAEWARTREDQCTRAKPIYDLVVVVGEELPMCSFHCERTGLKVALIHDRHVGRNAVQRFVYKYLGIYGNFERILKLGIRKLIPNGSAEAKLDRKTRISM